MAVIVENGSGVANANSYVTPAFVTAYLTDRNRATENGWTSPEGVAEQAAVIAATDHVENRFRESFRGSKAWRDISTARATWAPVAQPLNTETVTLGVVVYRFVTALAAMNDVLIGESLSESIDHLVAAINGDAGEAGDGYHASTVVNEDATSIAFIDDTLLVFARAPGTAGNAVASTTTVTGSTWNSATLAGGSDVSYPQPLSFPRTGLVDRDGVPIYGVPLRLKWAVAEYAARARAAILAPDPTIDPLGGTITSFREKVGPIETATEYLAGSTVGDHVPSYPAADRLLREYLRPAGVIRG